MDTRNCPYCKEPITGRTCANCGENWREADTVKCSDCGDIVAKEKATITRYENSLTAKVQADYTCWECE